MRSAARICEVEALKFNASLRTGSVFNFSNANGEGRFNIGPLDVFIIGKLLRAKQVTSIL
jgi:hypothetical protein